MNKLIIYILTGLTIVSLNGFSQANLGPNGNYEFKTGCPDFNGNSGTIELATPWFGATSAPTSSSDYFHICSLISSRSIPFNSFGYQSAYSDSAYAGLGAIFNMEYREFLEVA